MFRRQHECKLGVPFEEISAGEAMGYGEGADGSEGRGGGSSYGKFFESSRHHVVACGFGEGGAMPGYEKDDGLFDGEGGAEFCWDGNLNGAGQALGCLYGDDDRPDA